MFYNVVMGYVTDSRPAPRYPPQMPIMEALIMLSFVAAGTQMMGLGTEVLVLPQRNPTLVAKRAAANLDQAVVIQDRIRVCASEAGRDVQKLGFQMMLASPPEKNSHKGFFDDDAAVLSVAEAIA